MDIDSRSAKTLVINREIVRRLFPKMEKSSEKEEHLRIPTVFLHSNDRELIFHSVASQHNTNDLDRFGHVEGFDIVYVYLAGAALLLARKTVQCVWLFLFQMIIKRQEPSSS